MASLNPDVRIVADLRVIAHPHMEDQCDALKRAAKAVVAADENLKASASEIRTTMELGDYKLIFHLKSDNWSKLSTLCEALITRTIGGIGAIMKNGEKLFKIDADGNLSEVTAEQASGKLILERY